MSEIIFLQPVFKDTIWGGTRLSEFNYKLTSSHIGECWAVSAHPNGDDAVLNEKYKSLTLSQLFNQHKELFGNIKSEKFPLLTKIIDAKSDLSIQVHPDDEYAFKNENGSLGKTECWYILDALPGTKIVIGHNAENHSMVESMINNRQWKDFIREVPVKKGDFFFIPPGTVHAIKGGTLILETQQSSDITYRVYDYDRLQNGKPRQLHIKQSIDVINAPFEAKEAPKNQEKTVNKNLCQLCSCNLFTVWHAEVKDTLQIEQDQPFMIVSVVEGSGEVDGIKIQKGAHFIVPYKYGKLTFNGNMELIVSSI